MTISLPVVALRRHEEYSRYDDFNPKFPVYREADSCARTELGVTVTVKG